jgi:hypothetical protein
LKKKRFGYFPFYWLFRFENRYFEATTVVVIVVVEYSNRELNSVWCQFSLGSLTFVKMWSQTRSQATFHFFFQLLALALLLIMDSPFIVEKLRNIQMYQIFIKIPQNESQNLEVQISSRVLHCNFHHQKWKDLVLNLDSDLNPRGVSVRCRPQHIEIKLKFHASSEELTNNGTRYITN